MVTKKQSRIPGHPKHFAPKQAVSATKMLFHQKGFNTINIAKVTNYLDINPPSLYAAFSNKARLFSHILNKYVDTKAIPLANILHNDRPIGKCLAKILKKAARKYSQNGSCASYMVLKDIHSHNPQAHNIAIQYYHATKTTIYNYIARQHPQSAQYVTNFISTIISRLSAKARKRHSIKQLYATAALAEKAIKTILKK